MVVAEKGLLVILAKQRRYELAREDNGLDAEKREDGTKNEQSFSHNAG